MTPISQTVSEILADTYGKNAMTRTCAVDLAEKIANYVDEGDNGYYLNREDMIRQTVWNWFSGGDTAAYVARRIEESLAARESV